MVENPSQLRLSSVISLTTNTRSRLFTVFLDSNSKVTINLISTCANKLCIDIVNYCKVGAIMSSWWRGHRLLSYIIVDRMLKKLC